MRLGIDVREVRQGTSTGIARYLCNFLDFVAQHPSGHELVLFGNQWTDWERLPSQFATRRLPERIRLVWDQWIVARAARTERVDLFYSPYHKGPYAVSCPLVVTVHDLYPFVLDTHRPRALLERTQYRLMLRRATAVIAVSQYVRQTLLERRVVDAARVHVVPNCVHPRFRPLDRTQSAHRVQGRFGIPAGYVLYVGSFLPYKNLSRLVEAYALLPQGLRRRHGLVFVGREDRHAQLLRHGVQQRGLAADIRFLGITANEELVDLYNAAGVVALISLKEGFGLPVVEGMACGVPVMASTATALPEVAGEAGYLVDPRDPRAIAEALERVLTDEPLRQQMIAKGFQQVQRFRWETVELQRLRVLEQVAGADAA